MKRTQFIYSGVRGERTESGLSFQVNGIGFLCSNLNDVKDIVHFAKKEALENGSGCDSVRNGKNFLRSNL